MLDFLKKHKTNNKDNKVSVVENTTSQQSPVPQPKADFVKQYTLTHPKNVSMDYNLFDLCETMPVWHEVPNAQSDFHSTSLQLPTKVFLRYLNALKHTPLDIDPKMRTISVVNMKNGAKLFILPNLQSPKNPISVCKDGDVALNTTPEINRAIVEQLKIFTR